MNKDSLDDYSDNESMTKSANKAKTTKIDASRCKSTENTLPFKIKNSLCKNSDTFDCVEELSSSLGMMSDEIQMTNSRKPNVDGVKMNIFEQPHNQPLPNEMMKKFHRSMKMCIYQCTVCHEAWPRQTRPSSIDKYVCSRCVRDKSIPRKFSSENLMIPSTVPKELQELTQFEEMLIARAFPLCMCTLNQGVARKHIKGMSLLCPMMNSSSLTYCPDAQKIFQF